MHSPFWLKAIKSDLWKVKKILSKISANKYLLVGCLFALQLAIFENINIFSLIKLKKQESALKQQVNTQHAEIERINIKSETLTNPDERERFAREVYHFKKADETVFVISNE